MIERVWPAKVCRRRTMNQPMTPAITATIVPASSALTMNWNETSSWRSVTGFQESPWKIAASGMCVTVAVNEGRLGLPDDDEPAVGGAQHLDPCSVEPAERFARDHVFRTAFDGGAAGDVDDAVEVAEDRGDVVGAHQDRHLLVPADPAHERRDGCLVGQVEAVERFVE